MRTLAEQIDLLQSVYYKTYGTPLPESNCMKREQVSDVTYEVVSDFMIEMLPELKAPYYEMKEWWGDELPGPHVVYGDILNPYLDKLIQSRNDEDLTRVFALIETLSRSPDIRVRGIVSDTICDHIVADDERFRVSRELMGMSTRHQCDDVLASRFG